MLVLVAVATLFARRRVSPAGLPRWLFLKAATATVDESDQRYLREIAAAPGDAFGKFTAFMPASMHRHVAAANMIHAARLGATLVEDCGPCAIICAQWAVRDGVPREAVNAMLAGDGGLSNDEKLALDFGRAVASQSAQAFDIGDQIEARHGRDVRLELAMAAALVRAYPGIKRGLGLSRACSLTPLRV